MQSKNKQVSKNQELETREKFKEELLNKNGAISSVVPGAGGKGLFGSKPQAQDSSDDDDDLSYIAMQEAKKAKRQ